jgi:hypothetical protein
MAIVNAVKRGALIYIYDESGRQIGTVCAGEGAHEFTSASISIRRGGLVYIYDEKGRQTGIIPV